MFSISSDDMYFDLNCGHPVVSNRGPGPPGLILETGLALWSRGPPNPKGSKLFIIGGGGERWWFISGK